MLTALGAEGVAVKDQATDEIEPLNSDSPHIDRIAASDPFVIALCETFFNNLFINSCLKLGASWVQTSSARTFLYAVHATNQTDPSVRTFNSDLNCCA